MAFEIFRSEIGKRLFLAFGAIVILTIATAIASIYSFEQIRKADRLIIERTAPAARSADAIKSSIGKITAILQAVRTSRSTVTLEQVREEVRREGLAIEVLLAELAKHIEVQGAASVLTTLEIGLDRQIAGRLTELKIGEQQRLAIEDTVSALQILSDSITPSIVRANQDLQRIVAGLNRRGMSGDDLRAGIRQITGPEVRRLLDLNETRARARSITATFQTLDEAVTDSSIERSKAILSLNLRVLTRLTLATRDPQLKARLASGLAKTVAAMNEESGAVALSKKLVVARRDVQTAYLKNLESAEKLRGLSEVILVSANQSAAAASANNRRVIRDGNFIVTGISAVAIVAALLILWLYAYRSLIRRLAVLTATTRALARGDMQTAVPQLGTDEIGELGVALNVFKHTAERVLEQEQALQQANQRLEHSNTDLQLSQRETEIVSQRLSDAIEAIPNGFLLWDADNSLILANEKYREMRPDMHDFLADNPNFEQLTRHSIVARLPDAPPEEIEAEFQRVMALHEPGNSRDQFRLPDGKWVQLEVRRTAEGGFVGVYTDITEIIEARNQLSAAIENMQNGFLLWGADRRLVLCNERARELMPDRRELLVIGTSIEEFASQGAQLRAKGTDADDARRDYENIVERHYRAGAPYEVKQPDGRWHQIQHQNIDGGEMVSIVFDITLLKQTQHSLEHQATELQRSNEELEQFAYLASHDLQEPLRVVASYCDLLSKRYADKFDDDGRDFLNFAVDGAHRMRSLIDDLLTYSRVGRGAIEWESVKLSEAIEDAKSALWSQIDDTGAVVTSDELPAVAGSHQLVTQLFQNLISNSIKFRSEEKVAIHISTTRDDDFYKICVSDNGIGIEEKFVERVFRMFQRLHNREDYAGNGLGLALCQRVVQRHGGEIWVEPSPPPGTTICFTLPTVGTAKRPQQESPEA